MDRSRIVGRRVAGLLAPVTLFSAVVSPPAIAGDDPAPMVDVVVKLGDAVDGLTGTVAAIERFAVDDGGATVAQVRMAPANPAADQVLLRGDEVLLVEGQPLPAAPAFTVVSWTSVRVGGDGRIAQVMNLAGPGGTSPAVVVDGAPVLLAGDSAAFFGAPAGSTWTAFDFAVPRGAGRVTVRGTLLDAGAARDAVVDLFILGGQLILQSGRLVEGQMVDARGVAGGISATPADVSVAPSGGLVLTVDLLGQPSGVDGLLAIRPPGQGWMGLAREGSPSPVPGRNWSGLYRRSVGINDAGDWAVQGSLSGDSATNQLLVLNGGVFAREGDTIDLGDGTAGLQGFGLGPLAILPDGRLIWLADWDGPIGSDRGLFVDRELLIRAGQSEVDGVDFGAGPVDGVLVSGLEAVEDNWAASANGAWAVVRGSVRSPAGDDVPALLRTLVLGPCAGDVDGDDEVAFGDLVRVLSGISLGDPGGGADVDGDGDADFADLVLVLATWGPC